MACLVHGLLLLFLLLVLFVLQVLYQCYFHPLAKVPGPFWARITKLWLAYKTWQGQLHKDNLALHEIYGPVVRIAPDQLSFTSLEALQTIYGASNGFPKSDFYRKPS